MGLAAEEANNANILNNQGQANFQGMANMEAKAANILNQFENAERTAVQQLDQLDQMISNLENQLS